MARKDFPPGYVTLSDLHAQESAERAERKAKLAEVTRRTIESAKKNEMTKAPIDADALRAIRAMEDPKKRVIASSPEEGD